LFGGSIRLKNLQRRTLRSEERKTVLALLFTTASGTTHRENIQVLEKVKSTLWASYDCSEMEEVYLFHKGLGVKSPFA